jgi:hypothetical protein
MTGTDNGASAAIIGVVFTTLNAGSLSVYGLANSATRVPTASTARATVIAAPEEDRTNKSRRPPTSNTPPASTVSRMAR